VVSSELARPPVGKRGDYHEDGSICSIDHSVSWIRLKRFLERYKIYLGIKAVKLVVGPYKTRTAFTNLSSPPPTIHLNEYLIDDEEVVEYLILRELIHIKLNMYPPMRYSTPSLSYAAKFNSALNFFMPKEKVEEIREKMEKLIEVNRRLQ